CDWAPVLTFVKRGALPSTKIDSTDACAAAAQLATTAAAAKHSITPAGGAMSRAPVTKSTAVPKGSTTKKATAQTSAKPGAALAAPKVSGKKPVSKARTKTNAKKPSATKTKS